MEVVRGGKKRGQKISYEKIAKKSRKKCFSTMGKVKRSHEILCSCLHLPHVVPPSLATTVPMVW